MSDRFVYFLRPVGQRGPIKIGSSKSPKTRLDQYLPWSPVKLEIVAAVPGSLAHERHLHALFAKDRLHHEWFDVSADLLALIERVLAENCLPDLPSVLRVNVSERPREFAKLYRAGATLVQIGDQYGLTKERVRQILRRHGVESLGCRPRRPTPLSAEQREVVSLYEAGLPLKELSARFGGMVCTVLRKAGVAGQRMKQLRAATRARDEAIAAAYLRGESLAAISPTGDPAHVYRSLGRLHISPNR